jgi:cellulose synthase/poly-beta-1,6-N-acetylglucosamine synthase-like glycosyltransferase
MASANFIVRRDAFEAIGGFDESLTTGEDSEIGRKLNAAGHRIYEAREIRVAHHRNPKSIGAFFRQQLWHSRGMFGATRQSRWNKAVLMTVCHLAFLVVGMLAVFLLPASFGVRISALVAFWFAVPVLTVLYRFRQADRIHHPLANILLYFLYFLARGWMFLRLVLSGQRAR